MLLPLCRTLSNHSRWPSKLNDYLSVGRPVVATRVGEVAPLFERHEIGITCADDPAELGDAIIRLLDDETLSSGYGQACRKLATSDLHWESLTAGLERLYRRTIATGARSSEKDRVA
jgi:glycosyltransferase involved in cell wall biosynthesis